MIMRMRAPSLGVVLSAFLMLWAGPAFGNGRFPTAQQLVVHPSDPNRIWLRATHGILTSADRGATWHWICEQSVDYSGTEDPAIGVTASGTLLAGIFNGLALTHDNGCDFAFDQAIGRQNVVDVSVEKNDPTRALAITSTGDGTGKYVNEVWRSTDSGVSWVRLGPNLDPTLLALTLDPAPSDPKTIYVTGFVYLPSDGGTELPTKGILLRTSDDGQTWESIEISGTSGDAQPYLSAVDPSDPNKLYVRVQGPPVSDPDSGFVENWLLYSEDGGDSFREVFRGDADFLGFALAPDGQNVFIGMGDSRTLGGSRPGNEAQFGLYRASIPAFDFQRVGHMGGVPVGHIGCLTFDGEELWVCTSEFAQGFELARSNDRGVTLESVMHLSDLEGPVPCGCETRTGSLCPDQWPGVCQLIGRCEDGNEVPAFCGDAGPSGGAAGSNDGGGGNGAGNDGGGSSCGCRTPGGSSLGAGAFAALVLAAGSLFMFARRRRH